MLYDIDGKVIAQDPTPDTAVELDTNSVLTDYLGDDVKSQIKFTVPFEHYAVGSYANMPSTVLNGIGYQYSMIHDKKIWINAGTKIYAPTFWGYYRFDTNGVYVADSRTDNGGGSTRYRTAGYHTLEHDGYYLFTFSTYAYQNGSYVDWSADDARPVIQNFAVYGRIYASKHPKEVSGIVQESYDSFIKSVSHRGWFQDGQIENTMYAFEASKANGYVYVETDLWCTSDGVAVLHHTGVLSDGTGIGSHTYEELQTYVLGTGTEYETTIPTLDEFVLWCKVNCIHPYLEMKGYSDTFFEIVCRYGMQRNVTWISGSFDSLEKIHELDPGARLGFLGTDLEKLSSLSNGYNDLFIDLQYGNVSEEICMNAAKKGIAVEAWTLTEGAVNVIVSLAKMGVTGFTVDSGHCMDIVQRNTRNRFSGES